MGRKTTRGRSRSAKRSAAMVYQFIATLKIKRGRITTTDTITSFPTGPVVWKIENSDDAPYTVSIDYTKIVHQSNKKHEHPFPKDEIVSAPVGNKGTAAIVAVLQNYKAGAKDGYEYFVDLVSDNAIVDTLDPELDVVDPGSFPQ